MRHVREAVELESGKKKGRGRGARVDAYSFGKRNF
jgi:hypothetical protein